MVAAMLGGRYNTCHEDRLFLQGRELRSAAADP